MIEGSRRPGPFDLRWQLREALPAAALDFGASRWYAEERAAIDAENEGMPPKPEPPSERALLGYGSRA
jgi:hypothetical protein